MPTEEINSTPRWTFAFLWPMDSFHSPYLTARLRGWLILNINDELDPMKADEDRLSRLPPKRLACQCLKWSICDSAAGSCWLPGWRGVNLPEGVF